jgi:hypothetical protein
VDKIRRLSKKTLRTMRDEISSILKMTPPKGRRPERLRMHTFKDDRLDGNGLQYRRGLNWCGRGRVGVWHLATGAAGLRYFAHGGKRSRFSPGLTKFAYDRRTNE